MAQQASAHQIAVMFLAVGALPLLALTSCEVPETEAPSNQITQLMEVPVLELASYLDQQTVLISAGEFLMGSDSARQDEMPARLVYLDAYWIDRYEITNLQYRRFIQETGSEAPRYWSGEDYPPGQAAHPVVGISWKEAEAYCKWAGKRLPTEAEWEKACRGDRGLIYPWGNDPRDNAANVGVLPGGPQPEMWDQAWDFLTSTHPGQSIPRLMNVGSFPEDASPFGVYDLVGNASEWVADCYNWDGYEAIGSENPLVLDPTWNHVVRGSAWLMPYGTSLGGHDLNRCSARSSSHGDTRDARMGFRCASSP